MRRLSARLQNTYELKLDLLPQPWTGSIHTAEVFMLALNPGFSPDDSTELRNEDYAEQWRLALSFQTRTPFYFLDPAFKNTGGYRWWARRLRELIAVVGIEAVARKVMCIEHFPYKSVSYPPFGVTLPSQHYSFAHSGWFETPSAKVNRWSLCEANASGWSPCPSCGRIPTSA